MQGLVVKSTGSWYTVRTPDSAIFQCKIKGNFRIKGIKTTNPITVGDYVGFTLTPDNTGLINEIHERKNCIIRKSVNLSKQTHLIAANVDQAFLVVSMFQPRTPLGFMDRFLVTTEAYQIPATIVFNKIDIYENNTLSYYTEIRKMYEDVGYKCLDTSALHNIHLDELRAMMNEDICLFSGNSGVGKSALINALSPDLSLKVNDVSGYNEKGRHTTTFAEMHETPFGAYIIDTPGIKEFGMVDFSKEELSLFFPEMRALANQCKFDNCTHEHEPQCAVKKAVEENKIYLQRYKSYLNILHGEEM